MFNGSSGGMLPLAVRQFWISWQSRIHVWALREFARRSIRRVLPRYVFEHDSTNTRNSPIETALGQEEGATHGPEGDEEEGY